MNKMAKKILAATLAIAMCGEMMPVNVMADSAIVQAVSNGTYDFKNLEQLPENWEIVNPTDGGIEFTEKGAVIHATSPNSPSATENQLRYAVPLESDWTAETHITLSRPLSAKYEQIGFYVNRDTNNWLMMNQEQGGDERIQIYWSKDGSIVHKSSNQNIKDLTDVWFRLTKNGDNYEFYYSTDGVNFTYIDAEPTDGRFEKNSYLQIFASTQNKNNPSFDATVEYCKITRREGTEKPYNITVEDNDVCDVTYKVDGEAAEQVPDGSDLVFTVVPKDGKVLGSNTIVVTGTSGAVTKTRNADGSWTITVPRVKGDIKLSVYETLAATNITFDGRNVKGFHPDKLNYTVNVTELPKKIAATASDDVNITYEQPTEENPVGKVILTRGEQTLTYTLNFEVTAVVNQMSNPYLPLWEHIPDGEPHVFEDPDNPGKQRVYIYGSHDTKRSGYCGYDYVTWSAPVEDLSQWRYEGRVYSCGDAGASDGTLFAPDVCYKDGLYYLYIHDWSHSSNIRVATSKRPDGPFTFEKGHDNAIVRNPYASDSNERVDFDPAVFVDDDGRTYLYWGAFNRTGFGSGELEDDMQTLKKDTWTYSNITNAYGGKHQTGAPFYFDEAASVRKVDDMYVLVYSAKFPMGYDDGIVNNDYRGRLVYAYSENPLGPWTYGGCIVDNGGELVSPGKVSYDDGNNHGGIVEINGQWYVFYHRMTNNNEYARQGMVEPIEVKVTTDENGKKAVVIPQVEMTSQGANKNGLDAYNKWSAGLACYLTGGAYITTGYRENPDYNPIIRIKNGTVAGYKYMNFGTGASQDKALKLDMDIKSKGAAGTIKVYIDKPNDKEGTLIGSVPVAAGAGEYQTVSANMSNVTGKHALYFVFESAQSGEICEVNNFQFHKDGESDAVSSISLNKNSLKLQTGDTEQLTAKVLPETAAGKVTWSSDNEAAATVKDGLVTAVAQGKATITATVGDKSASCVVVVKDSFDLQSFDFTKENITKDDVKTVWDVIRENNAKWTIDNKGMTIGTETGDLYTNTNTAKNMFYQDAPGDWEVETSFELDKLPYQDYHQAGLIVYQDDDNYLKFTYAGNSKGAKTIEINTEKNQGFTNVHKIENVESNHIWLRLKKEGDVYTASYSTDGTNYTVLNPVNFALNNTKLVLTANNGTRAADEIKASYKYFKVIGDESQEPKETYKVTVVNGDGSGDYPYNKKLTVKANAPAVGMKFAGWKIGQDIVSSEEEYTFYVSRDMKLEAVYVKEDEIVVKSAKALLTNIIKTKRPDGKYDVKFVGEIIVPDGYTIENAGLVWSSKKDTDLVLGGKLKPTYITQISDTNQFSVTIKGMPAANFIRGRIFATVKKAEDSQVIYSDAGIADPENNY